jgi:hypothetical protein
MQCLKCPDDVKHPKCQRARWSYHRGVKAWLLGLLGVMLWLGLHVLPACAQDDDRILLIGGNYRIRGVFHNMQDGYFGAPPIGEANDNQRFLDTRLRLSFDLRPHPMIRVNYQLEIGDITFGATNPPIVDNDGRRLFNVGGGGRPGADAVNLETKNAYIDIQLPWLSGLSFRGGILGWGDQFDWTVLSTDFTGLQFTYQREAWWSQFTYLKFAEGQLRTRDDSDWFALDTRYAFSPQTSLTGSVYFWNDNANDNPQTGDDAYQVYAGLKFNTVIFGKAQVELSGVFNAGQDFLGQAHNEGPNGLVRGGLTGSRNRGFMANVHVDYPIGPHWLGFTLQYISGERGSRAEIDGSGRNVDAFIGLFNQQYSGFGRSRFAGGGGLELITLGHLNGSTAGLNNVSVSPFFGGGYNGRLLGVLRAKFRATPVLFVYTAAGLDMAAEENVNGDRFRGIELNAYLHWDIMPKLWLRSGVAYMFTGDWWKDNPDVSLQGFPDPLGLQSQGAVDDIFQFMVRLQYDFG